MEGAGPRNPLVDGIYHESPFVTPDFVQKVDKIVAGFGDQGGFDPILCAQDMPSQFIIDNRVMERDRARVVVRSDFPGHTFTVEMMKATQGWQIDNVVCSR